MEYRYDDWCACFNFFNFDFISCCNEKAQDLSSRNKVRNKLASIIFSATAIVLFSMAIFQGTQAQSINFIRDLALGSRGDDVKILQQFLNSRGVQVSASGPGSIGNETTYFGGATKVALAKWQAGNGISPAIGYFGPKSRASVAAMAGSSAQSPLPSTSPILAPVSSADNAELGLPIRL